MKMDYLLRIIVFVIDIYYRVVGLIDFQGLYKFLGYMQDQIKGILILVIWIDNQRIF